MGVHFLKILLTLGIISGCAIISWAIVGGVATTEPYPFFVKVSRSNFFCGGTIISSNAVLTAAHCLYMRNHVLEFEANKLLEN